MQQTKNFFFEENGDFSAYGILHSLDVASLSDSPSEIGDKGHLGEGGWKLEIYQSVEVSYGSNQESVLWEVCI